MAAPIWWRTSGKAPQDYDVMLDPKHSHCGTRSAQIRSIVEHPRDFVTLTQSFAADDYRGKRLRMSAWVKTHHVEGRCFLWLRFDDGEGHLLVLDNMQDRPIHGTRDWAQYEVVMDVPGGAHVIHFGIALHGTGTAWTDDFAFEAVGRDVPVTHPVVPRKPRNLDFEE